MFDDLDPLIHSQLRLTIMSYLISKRETDFKELKEISKATSGNLSVQLKKLEEAQYLELQKGFKDNYPHTQIRISKVGIDAFEKYVHTLKLYIQPGEETGETSSQEADKVKKNA